MRALTPIPLAEIDAARARIEGAAIRAPLLRLDSPDHAGEGDADGDGGIWLKLECLQPIGSFKIRGAVNAMALADPRALADGVYTASAGNMAQGVAFAAQRLGIGCRVIVPDSAPTAKLDAIRALGGELVTLPYDEWWAVIREHGHPDERGFFVHPVADPAVIAGNGTIGVEILEDLPDVTAVFVPYGGGGLSCGIASAMKGLRPEVRVFATEVETAAPFAASLEAGSPVSIERTPSFVDGIGGGSVLEEMWPLASGLLSGSHVVTIEETCEAIRTLVARAHIVAEGAGASAVAAAMAATVENARAAGPIVAVVSGGNIDTEVLRTILAGGTPEAR
jgi:threonine dehydratase